MQRYEKVLKFPVFPILYIAIHSWRNSVYATAKTAYDISLKGYVGGLDFDSSKVDKELAKNEGKEINVLIDSLGSLATGLSISAAFKNHGKVNVHFVGLNASAATIASLGAAHISIDTVDNCLDQKNYFGRNISRDYIIKLS